MKNSAIEWTDHTFNPWMGCTKVSPGCDHCYAEAMMAGRMHMVQWGPDAPRRRTSPATWREPIRWNAEAERTGTRPRVFCASLADVFDNEVPVDWRVSLFRLIAETPALTWLLLTKRIGNAQAMLREVAKRCGGGEQPMPNVWLGATVVNQQEADRDVPKLLQLPAARRFLSIEPMLGPIDLHRFMVGDGHDAPHFRDGHLDWVIVGGESGPQARPMHPDWPRALRDQCAAAGVPFFFKQWGEWANADAAGLDLNVAYDTSRTGGWVDLDGAWCAGETAAPQSSHATHVFRIGKKAAGRQFGGRTWDEVPG